MSDFTDDEDRQLVQLAAAFSDGGRQIPWDELTRLMVSSTHSKDELRQRLKTLKRTHGRDLGSFPGWFYRRPVVNAATIKAISSSASKRRPATGRPSRAKVPQSTVKLRSRPIKMSDLLSDGNEMTNDVRSQPKEEPAKVRGVIEEPAPLLWVLALAAESRTLIPHRQK